MAIDKITIEDDKLLNLVNNTILQKTEFEISDFSGGSVGITSTNNNTQINYRVSLFFGYKNKKPVTRTITIEKDSFYIWCKALMLKVASIKNENIGMNYNELFSLMNSSCNSNSISNKVKYSIVGVDLPVDLHNDILILQKLSNYRADEIQGIKIEELGLSHITVKYINQSKLQDVINLSVDNTKYLIEELKNVK